MSIYTRFELNKGNISNFIDTSLNYTCPNFSDNSENTCAGQVMAWFMSCAGQLPGRGEGLRQPLMSPNAVATSIHFYHLGDGWKKLLTDIADSFVDLRGNNSAQALKSLTPWTGSYKLYGIASDKGDGHVIGVYFPVVGKNQFFDPNLVAGPCTDDKWLWHLLQLWPSLYLGLGGEGATWGFECLFVFKDPMKALGRLKSG